MKIPAAYKTFINSQKRYNFIQGGAGAGKSEAVARKVVIRALIYAGRHLVVRKYATTLKQSVMHTIINILKSEKIVYEINKTERVITLSNGAEIIFMGLDDSEKIKSIHEILTIWVEEASEITRDDFIQLDLRLRGNEDKQQIILTYNPVSQAKFLLDEINKRSEDEVFYKIYTYKDNVFLSKTYKKILNDIDDINYKNIYVDGIYTNNDNSLIFTNYKIEEININNFDYYGVDFGFNNPTAVVAIKKLDNNTVYVKEMLYKSRVTNNELIEFLKNKKINCKIYCDSAEPARIEEMRLAGLNAKPANKSVKEGIAYLKQLKLVVDGVNLIKELEGYCYKVNKEGNLTEEIVKLNDHLIDAMRYAIYTDFMENKTTKMTEKEIILVRGINAVI
ncbi:MAG: PBSX family phage terminase large subunit [Candidatus Omnitrophica bacterium]|nr:PBSX family phage terminase large subunit [Candidatus Omnitrophota bacterium]